MKVGLYELPDLLNPEACDAIIDYCKDKVYPMKRLNGFRSAYGMWLNPATHTGMERIISTIQDCIRLVSGLDISHQEHLHVIRYTDGGEYQPHWDYFHEGDNRIDKGGNRMYTFLFYLNDNYKGGETKFTLLDKVVEPKSGKLILWNNLNEDGDRNVMSKHAGLPVEDGEKWIITCWVRERPYK